MFPKQSFFRVKGCNIFLWVFLFQKQFSNFWVPYPIHTFIYLYVLHRVPYPLLKYVFVCINMYKYMNITLSIPDELNSWFDNYCKRKGTKKSTYINFLLEQKRQYDQGPQTMGPISPDSLKDIKVTPEQPISSIPTKLPPMDDWGNVIQETPKPWFGPSPARAKLDKIAKSLKTDDKCPHGIAKGGYCKACGGLAK